MATSDRRRFTPNPRDIVGRRCRTAEIRCKTDDIDSLPRYILIAKPSFRPFSAAFRTRSIINEIKYASISGYILRRNDFAASMLKNGKLSRRCKRGVNLKGSIEANQANNSSQKGCLLGAKESCHEGCSQSDDFAMAIYTIYG